jgi:hypothetical protein
MSWSLKLLSQYHKVAAAGCVSPQNPIKAFVLHSYLSSTSGESRMQIVLAERPSRHDLDLARINNFAVAFTLAAIAQNLRRLAKLIARPPPIAPLCAA